MEHKGGEQLTHRWFNVQDGRIYWAAKQEPCRGIACLLNRGDVALLSHELTHLLMYRALGEDYPQEEHWHDVSHWDSSDSWSDGWMRLKTSIPAAYIEGLANAMEYRGLTAEHPYRMSLLEDINSMYRDKKLNKYCYFRPQVLRRLIKGGLWDNETYVSTSIARLFDGFRPQVTEADPEEANLNSNWNVTGNGGVYVSYHPVRIKA